MGRLLAVFCCTLLLPLATLSKHIAGGEMSYTYLGPGSTTGTGRYEIRLRLYRDCNAPAGAAQLDKEAQIVILQRNSTLPFATLQVPLARIERAQIQKPDPCFTNPPAICFDIGVYTASVELPFVSDGYEISYQQCCRINDITNIVNTPFPNEPGAKYLATVPGIQPHPLGPRNNSPRFNGGDTVIVCRETPFTYDFSATDADGDSLAYEFTEAYVNTPAGAPNKGIAYAPGYSLDRPMGPLVDLHRNTGRMGGRAPQEGVYVVTVQVLEYRDGILINRHRKDLHIRVADCNSASVDLETTYINCDGLSLTFQNNNNDPLIKTYHWDFGVAGVNNDTSVQQRPTFTFPDTGVYRVRLITNRNLECADTGYTDARIFPGFTGGFKVDDGCKDVPLAFRDTSKPRYGIVDSWRWEFGYPVANPATSDLPNPTYTYAANGVYDVRLIVGSSKGCRDTVDRKVNILGRPSLAVSTGQSVCKGDSVRLRATGAGNFSWSPATGLSSTTIPDPIAFPAVKTRYYVTLSNGPGCQSRDSVDIDVTSNPLLVAGRDTTICLTDTIRLNPSSDGTRFSWQPAATLDDPSAKNPLARPTGTTTYFATAWLGGSNACQSRDSIKVTTVPYPKVALTPDTTVCLGDAVILRASGGVEYSWSPSAGLSDSAIANPVATPLQNTTYRVEVRDIAGCPKPGLGSVLVKVAPRIRADAGRDTSIVPGQPLRLNGSGGDIYLWSPPTGLSDPNTANPSVDIIRDQRYVLTVTSNLGCSDRDTVLIRVFQSAPDIFVPSAFTPNGDGLNDRLTPIPVGIKEIQFFRVYNRWGQLVFSSSGIGRGWDGRFNGKAQLLQTLAWHVRGIAFDGRVVEKKGTVTLYR